MDYNDFYDIAEYGSEHWRGKFTPKEIGYYAYVYICEYIASKTHRMTDCIKELLDRLDEDDTLEAREWADRIREGIKYGY